MDPRSFIVGDEIWSPLGDSQVKVSSRLADLLLLAPNVHRYLARDMPIELVVRFLDGRELVYDMWTELSFDARGNLNSGVDSPQDGELIPGVAELFEISGDDFVADSKHQAWKYTGPLHDLREWFLEEFPKTEIIVKESGICKIVTEDQLRESAGPNSRFFDVHSFGDDLETAWRVHLGEIIVEETQPYSVLAADGQSLTELNGLLTDFEDHLPDHMTAGNDAEEALFERWRGEVAAGREVVGFRAWVRALKVRGPIDESPGVLSLDSPSLEEIGARMSQFADPDDFEADLPKWTGRPDGSFDDGYSPRAVSPRFPDMAQKAYTNPIDLWGDQDE